MTWTIDPNHSSILFAIRYFDISFVRGSFRKFSGTLDLDDRGQVSNILIEIETSGIDTNQGQRDETLRGEHFFNADRFPKSTFKGQVKDRSLGGELVLHGVAQQIALQFQSSDGPITGPSGERRRGASAEGVIRRGEFGVNGNMPLATGGMAIGDEVPIYLGIEAVSQ